MTPYELEQLVILSPPPSLEVAVQALLLAFVLGLAIVAVYRYSVVDRLVPQSLMATLTILPMVGALVMMVIGNSLARAFSLVGALAIVRFRTRLQSPWDMTFVFLSLAVGIACGITVFKVAIAGTVLVGLAVLTVGLLPGLRPRSDLCLVRCEVAASETGEAILLPVLDRHTDRRWLQEARSLRFGETLALSWRVRLRATARLDQLVRELSVLEGVERVTVTLGDGSSEDEN